ncbi:TonB-dependent receptor [Robbsia sp. Bb-Pol-6]|uniref:TonB-dependent receptor n=1 Tax=Robbsia betulipollinis TaxID=2981849 RepID=A0ABT3ZSL4_9BURK|nr:TonB-dependent receptor [Robbsia betulipollinis]MCY0389546.1 TonB-dependent receptor [Robbsia betulipollinis]
MRTKKFGASVALVAAYLSAPAAMAQSSDVNADNSVQTKPDTDTATPDGRLPAVDVRGIPDDGSAAAGYRTRQVAVGVLGAASELDTPFSVDTVPHALIENTEAHTLQDVLRYLPSTQFDERFSDDWGRLQTRGFQSNLDNVYVDGIPVTGNPLSQIPVEEFESLQVLNGVSAFAFGPQFPSGAFNIITKAPTAEPSHSMTTGYISNAQYFVSGDYSDRVGPVAYRFNVLQSDGEGYVSTSHVDRTYFSGAVDLTITRNDTVHLSISHYDYRASGFPGFFYMSNATEAVAPAPNLAKAGYGQPWAVLRDDATIAEVKWDHRFDDDWKFSLGVNWESSGRQTSDVVNTLTPNGSGGYTNKQTFSPEANGYVHTETMGNAGTLTGHFTTGPVAHTLTVGIIGTWTPSTHAANVSSAKCNGAATCTLGTTSYGDPIVYPDASAYHYDYGGEGADKSTSFEQSLVVGDKLDFGQHWSLLGAVAQTWIGSTSFTNSAASYLVTGTSPTVGLMFKPIKPLMFYATYADGINVGETPAATATSASGKTLTVTNAYDPLRPTSSKQFEIGAKADWGRFTTTLDAFRITKGFSEYVDNGNGTATDTQAGMQRNVGVEFMVTGKVTPDLTVMGGMTWLHARLVSSIYADAVGKQPAGVPEWQGNIYAEYALRFLRPGLSVDANLHYTGVRPAIDTGAQSVKGYVTLDLGTRYDFKLWGHATSWRLNVRNVTNTRYWANVVGSAAGDNGTTAAQLMAGDPLTVSTSLQFHF